MILHIRVYLQEKLSKMVTKDTNLTVRVPAAMKANALKFSKLLDRTLSQVVRKALIELIDEGLRKESRDREALARERKFKRQFQGDEE